MVDETGFGRLESRVVEGTPLGDVLGATEAAIDTADPVSLGRSYLGAMRRAARRPLHSVPAWLRYGVGLGMTGTQLVTRAVGVPLPEVIQPAPGDARFRDPTWQDNIAFHGLLQAYLLTNRLLRELVEAAGLPAPEGPKAEFAAIAARRRARTHQPVAHQPARVEARVRDRRHEHRARPAQLPARPGAQRRLAPAGGPLAVRARPQRRGHAGAGRVPQRAHRGAPVPPDDGRGVRAPAARGAALDQPLLHRRPRAGEEPRAVGGRARPHHLRGELPEPGRVDARPHLRRLPASRAADRHRRGARDRGQRDGEHPLDLPRGHHDRDGRRVPRCVRRSLRALGHLPELRGRLRGRGIAGDGVRRPRHARQPDAADGTARLPPGQGHRPYLRPAARQRPRVPLRRRQLVDG